MVSWTRWLFLLWQRQVAKSRNRPDRVLFIFSLYFAESEHFLTSLSSAHRLFAIGPK